jgi:hypothetical protein
MKPMIVTKNVEGLLAALVLLAGCAEAPRVAKEAPEPAPAIGERKDPCRGTSCVSQPAEADEWDHAQEDDDGREPRDGPTAEPEGDARSARQEDAADADDEDVATTAPAATFDASSNAMTPPLEGAVPPTMHGETDASADPAPPATAACDPNPCRHGGACAGGGSAASCICPDGFVGEHCETRSCGSATIHSQADLDALRDCSEIRGDLTIASVGLATIEANDLPLLTKISGDLIISGPQISDRPLLESVTLKHLRTIEGALMVLGLAVVEFGASGPLRELHLPALERIGAHDALGLAVYQASLTTLDLPALEAIEGTVILDTLFELCTLRVASLQSVGGALNVRYVPKLPAEQLEPFRAGAAGQVSEQLLGCCEADLEDRVSCEAFTENARALYCGGCH